LGWSQKSLIACFWHQQVEDTERGRCDSGKKKNAGVRAEVMHDGTSDDLAERSAKANRRGDGPEGEIKAARALRKVGYHEHRDFFDASTFSPVCGLESIGKK
jgi:hypothetical protein